MKKCFLFLFAITLATSVLSQDRTVKFVPADYCSSNKSPLVFLKGDTIVADCDTIYLVNKGRYTFYKNIHKATLSNKDSICNKLLNAYELRLSEHQDAYDKLLDNSKQSEKITLDLMSYTQNSLVNTQKTLDYSRETLEQTLKSLALANDYIKKEKWNARGQKLLTGIGGAGIGLLIGILLMK
jgi:ElaB/YqjD/DUF883 family membrane-anchored ribosome-binding protein